jgi:hypothetical protein
VEATGLALDNLKMVAADKTDTYVSSLSVVAILRLSRVCPVASTSYKRVTVVLCHLIAACVYNVSGGKMI